MNIIKSKKFNHNLKNTLEFIASDNVHNAKAFKSELFLKLRNIPNFFPTKQEVPNIMMMKMYEI